MKSKLHILVLSSWYPTAKQPFLGNFVKRHVDLIAGEHQVTVLNVQSDPQVAEIQLAEVRNGNLAEITVLYPSSRNPFFKWLNARKAFRKGVESIRDIDLIHGNVILSKGLQFTWAKKHFQKPLIVTEHGSFFRKEISDRWSWKDKVTVKKVMQHADLVTAVSPFLRDEIRALYPLKEIRVLPNVIDPEIFSLQAKSSHAVTRFIHVSTLDESVKNISGILAACNALKAQCGAVFRMQVISDEPYGKWEAEVKRIGLDDCVFFSGPATPAEIAAQMHGADALLLFSNYETFSCVVAESWSTGTPVIATPVGIAAGMDPATGIQVEAGDEAALTAAMKSFVKGKNRFDPAKMREKAAEFFPAKVLKVINQVYESL